MPTKTTYGTLNGDSWVARIKMVLPHADVQDSRRTCFGTIGGSTEREVLNLQLSKPQKTNQPMTMSRWPNRSTLTIHQGNLDKKSIYTIPREESYTLLLLDDEVFSESHQTVC